MPTYVSLFKTFVYAMTDYIDRHNQNYTQIETTLNELLDMALGTFSGNLSVPPGLKEIFDRPGIIGDDSYGFTEGTLTGPDYNLAVNPGAYWNLVSFLSKATLTNISMAGQTTGTYYLYIDSSGVPNISATAVGDTIRSFAWDASTHVISSATLQPGIAILFDGDDYADMLTSTARSKTFTSVADRLEEIEQLMSETSGFYAEDSASHSMLDFYYFAGTVRNDSDFYDTAAGYVSLTDDATNYVEVDPTSGVVSANTTSFTSGKIGLFIVTTASGAITGVTDRRTWALAGTGGGGGGHTQNTDVGTTSHDFTLNNDEAGAPSANCSLAVERGTSPNVGIRWNETTDRWQYTNDGSTWTNIGEAASEGLGVQGFTKLTCLPQAQKVVEDLARGDSADFENLDLSGFITAPQGVEAVLLQVFFWDSAPAAGVNVQFKGGLTGVPTAGSTSYMARYQPVTVLVPLDSDLLCQFFVSASGTTTANLVVWLTGYFEKVTGVGTQAIEFTHAGISVGAAATVDTNCTNFLNRGLCHYLKVEETGGVVTGTYDIKIFSKDTFLDADLVYHAINISPASAYEDWLDFWVQDDDATSELHVRIINNDTGETGVYTVTLKCEQFA